MSETINDPPEFTDDELRAALKQAGADARNAVFAAGRPIMVAQDGLLVLLYPDGTRKVAGSVANGRHVEGH